MKQFLVVPVAEFKAEETKIIQRFSHGVDQSQIFIVAVDSHYIEAQGAAIIHVLQYTECSFDISDWLLIDSDLETALIYRY